MCVYIRVSQRVPEHEKKKSTMPGILPENCTVFVVCGLQLYDILLIARWCRSFQQAIAKVIHFITSDALDKKLEIESN
jgi:hypothetical protein